MTAGSCAHIETIKTIKHATRFGWTLSPRCVTEEPGNFGMHTSLCGRERGEDNDR
jgi:hypothetical protein